MKWCELETGFHETTEKSCKRKRDVYEANSYFKNSKAFFRLSFFTDWAQIQHNTGDIFRTTKFLKLETPELGGYTAILACI